MSDDNRVERKATVASKVGLHARPAKLVARTAAEQPEKVMISKEGVDPVEAKSTLRMLTLGAEYGDVVVVSAQGPQAEESVAAVVAMIERDLDEDA
jgi:phosphocarrier protein HPr